MDAVRAARRELGSPSWQRPLSGPGARSRSVSADPRPRLEPLPRPASGPETRVAEVRVKLPRRATLEPPVGGGRSRAASGSPRMRPRETTGGRAGPLLKRVACAPSEPESPTSGGGEAEVDLDAELERVESLLAERCANLCDLEAREAALELGLAASERETAESLQAVCRLEARERAARLELAGSPDDAGLAGVLSKTECPDDAVATWDQARFALGLHDS